MKYWPTVISLALIVTIAHADSDLSGIYEEAFASGRIFSDLSSEMGDASRLYGEAFSNLDSESLTDLEPDELRAAMLASFKMAFYSNFYAYGSREGYMRDAIERFNVAKSRGLLTSNDIHEFYLLLIAARHFSLAEEVSALSDGALPPPPKVYSGSSFDPHKPAEFSLDERADHFVVRNVAMDGPRTIVVSAGCAVSLRAARDIMSDPNLRARFEQSRVIWLGSTGELSLAHVKGWNRMLPGVKLSIAYDQSKWVGVDFSQQPAFHFYRNGRLISVVSGWAADGPPTEFYSVMEEFFGAAH